MLEVEDVMEKHHLSGGSLPFTEEDLVGPEDRPRPDWEVVMYEWHAYCNATVKEWLDEMAEGSILAVQCAAREQEGLIYVRACAPEAYKAHMVTVSPNQRTCTFSLYTTLLAFDFPKVSSSHKVLFRCRPATYGETKLLVVEVSGYRVEKVDRDTQEQVSAALSLIPGGKNHTG
jgi:hypothetical protein